ncbi:MAG: lytic transglycosylase domain-containing protein [Saprospiraceae bacterium]|nr:lytic transglycosylase domain-containing protein [Saprospiraceae bacterium]
MQKAVQIYTLILASFLTIIFFASYYSADANSKATNSGSEKSNSLPQDIRPVDLDRPFDFAGEKLPMDNFDVRERLDRELLINTYLHATTLLHIKSAYKYFSVIEKILAENDMPDDFKYMAVAESSLRNAVSSAGAKGIWQFVSNTGEYYGLEINEEVDERYHIEKATEAACKYLKDYKKQFGNWTLSAAAYNMGGPRLKRDMEAQRADNYYDLNLNDETSRYVFRLVAIKEVLKNPSLFGFNVDESEGYSPMSDFKVVEVNGPIASLGDFAIENGTTYRMLKVYNPWLISSKLTNKAKKTYQIKIPLR